MHLQPGERVVIMLPSGGKEPTIVIGCVLRAEGDDRIVASDSRTYPAEGGEDLGTHHPRHMLYPSSPRLEYLALVAAVEQRVLGLVTRYGRGGQYIASWNIIARIGQVDGAYGREAQLIMDAIAALLHQRLIVPVPDLSERYRLAPDPA